MSRDDTVDESDGLRVAWVLEASLEGRTLSMVGESCLGEPQRCLVGEPLSRRAIGLVIGLTARKYWSRPRDDARTESRLACSRDSPDRVEVGVAERSSLSSWSLAATLESPLPASNGLVLTQWRSSTGRLVWLERRV